MHLGLHALFASWSRRWWGCLLEGVALTLYDVAMAVDPLPLTEGWMHEEGHWSTMGVNLLVPTRARR